MEVNKAKIKIVVFPSADSLPYSTFFFFFFFFFTIYVPWISATYL